MDHDRTTDLLVDSAVHGDVGALGRLLQSHRDDVTRYVERHLPAEVRNLIEPQDIVQDVHFEVFRRIRTFSADGPDGFLRWLLTITRNRIIDVIRHIRAAKRGGGRQISNQIASPAADASIIALLTELQASTRTPSESVLSRELVWMLHRCMGQLKEEHRTALQLRYLDGLAVAAVADRMARSEGATQMLCERALRSLRAELSQAWGR